MTQRSLDPGTQIARYRVVSLLGAGGMGEVYLARDESLDRSVALKILPPDLVKNDERVRRFVQEAKSASSLNHPHIVTIYEIGSAEIGAGDGGAPETIQFIAMELVSGHTLKTLIHQEKTDLKTLVRYLAQAADGLAKAHAAGIVHRDLKPENIMVTSDGFAKVVDFGLAKLTETAGSSDSANAPTELGRATGAGMILGTVGYMSPEQVQGKTVDHRSDIFSLGCVLYEAATRQRPFQADSDVETLHKILKERPQPIEEINADVPGELRRIVRRCLAKAPDQRAQGMKDLALELAELADEYDTLSASSGSGSRVASGVLGEAPPNRRMRALVAASATIAILALAGLAWSVWFRGGTAGRETATTAMQIRRVITDPNLGEAVLSPDGRQIAFTRGALNDRELWIRQLASGSELRLVSDQPNVQNVRFSPDGAFVFFAGGPTGGNQTLHRVPALGGTPQPLEDGMVNGDFALSPDGQQVAFWRDASAGSSSGVVLARLDGPEERVLPSEQVGSFAWSPDGATLAGLRVSISTPSTLFFVTVADGQRTPAAGLVFVPSGEPVWLDNRLLAITGRPESGGPGDSSQIWLVSYPDGQASRLTVDATGFTSLSGSADGHTLAATQRRSSTELWVAQAGSGDPGTRLLTTEGSLSRVAADDSRVIFAQAQDDSIWTMRPDGSSRRRLTPERLRSSAPDVSWSADLVVFQAGEGGGVSQIWRMTTDGRELRQVTAGEGRLPTLTPDGRTVEFVNFTSRGRGGGLFRQPVTGGGPEPVPPSALRGAPKHYSPNGRYVLGMGLVELPGGGRGRGLLAVPSAGGDPIWSRSRGPGQSFAWAPGSDAVDLVETTDGVQSLWRVPLARGEPRRLRGFDTADVREFAWSRDGTRLYYIRAPAARNDVVLITNFRPDGKAP